MNLHWKISQEGILVALLDPRFKNLKFASESLYIRTYEQLKNAYQNMRNLIEEDQEEQSHQIKNVSR